MIEHTVSDVQHWVLDRLCTAGVQTPAEIAVELDVHQRHVRIALGRLRRSGLVLVVPGCRRGYTAYRLVAS